MVHHDYILIRSPVFDPDKVAHFLERPRELFNPLFERLAAQTRFDLGCNGVGTALQNRVDDFAAEPMLNLLENLNAQYVVSLREQFVGAFSQAVEMDRAAPLTPLDGGLNQPVAFKRVKVASDIDARRSQLRRQLFNAEGRARF